MKRAGQPIWLKYVRQRKRFGYNKILEKAIPKRKKGVINVVHVQAVKPYDFINEP